MADDTFTAVQGHRARRRGIPGASLQHEPHDVRGRPTKVRTQGMRYGKETYLVLDTAGLHLVGKDLGTGLLGLGLVDVLHEDTLVLEDITLGFLVKRVVPARMSE